MDAKKKTSGISREVNALTGGNHSIYPTNAPRVLQAIKEKRFTTERCEHWVLSSFTNSARSDSLALQHWVKEGKTKEEYIFAKLNKAPDVFPLTPEDYEAHIGASDMWNKEKTFHLWELCHTYGLRFIVIADRWPGPETVEDLKDRYYSVVRKICKEKGLLKDSLILTQPYNADYERRRKAQMEKVMLKTKELEQEELNLIDEAQKLNAKIIKEEKEVKSYEKLMKGDFDIEYFNVKSEPIVGPVVRSSFLTKPQIPSRLNKKIEHILSDFGIAANPPPTEDIVTKFELLKKEIIVLLNLQKHVIRKENEKKSIDDKTKEIRSRKEKRFQPPLLSRGNSSQVIEAQGNPGSRNVVVLESFNTFGDKTVGKKKR